jgi:hypothetical protein
MSSVKASATAQQRIEIKALLAAAGYDRGEVTRKYRRLGTDDAWVGKSAASWLESLRFNEAERAIAQLKRDAKHGAEAGHHTATRQASRA